MRNRKNEVASTGTFNKLGATMVHAAAFCFLFLLICAGAYAQTSQGFTGLVTDSTGAVIPKAKVTVHNEGTGVDKIVITTSTGNWTVPFLDPGVYDVRAEGVRIQVARQNQYHSVDR